MLRMVRRMKDDEIRVDFDNFPSPWMAAQNRTSQFEYYGLSSFDDTGKFDQIRIWCLAGESTNVLVRSSAVLKLLLTG